MLLDIRELGDIGMAVESARAALAGDLWWRGHADGEWKLVPKVFRPPSRAAGEHNLTIPFRLRAVSRRAGCPAHEDRSSWLFLMQHYGLPTRLLDWTESALTALFFAVENDERDTQAGALWALNPLTLNSVQFGDAALLLPEDVAPLFDAAFGVASSTKYKTVAVAPAEVDLRLMVQLSQFTVHSVDTPLEELSKCDTFLRKYAIPAEAKKRLREWLALLGIRRANLFPDLENLATDIDMVSRHEISRDAPR